MLDIERIREELNSRTFQGGERRAMIGRLSELVEEYGAEQAEAAVRRLQEELESQALTLVRPQSDPDALIVVQRLRSRPSNLQWLNEATMWVTRITTIVAEMLLPGLVGRWLDVRWGVSYWTPCGFAAGMLIAVWHLWAMTRDSSRPLD